MKASGGAERQAYSITQPAAAEPSAPHSKTGWLIEKELGRVPRK